MEAVVEAVLKGDGVAMGENVAASEKEADPEDSPDGVRVGEEEREGSPLLLPHCV